METEVIRISQTEGNATPLVRAALNACRSDRATVISFEPGVYRFYREGTLFAPFYPSNNASGCKHVVFPICSLSNVTVDGNGAEFLFCDRIFPFVIQNSHGICLRHFSVDFSFPRHCEGEVLSSDESGLSLRIDRERFPFSVDEQGHLLFQAGQDVLSTAQKKLFLCDMSNSSVPVAYLFAGDSSCSQQGLAARAMLTDAFLDGDVVRLTFRSGSPVVSYGAGDRLLISNDEDRENDVIFAENSAELCIDGISIYRGAGMGIVAQLCRDICIENLYIGCRPDRPEMLSVTADALHFIHCTGTLVIRNSCIEHSVDDALNVHGMYGIVEQLLPDASVLVGFGHPEQSGIVPYQPGDLLHFSDPDTTDEVCLAAVREVFHAPDRSGIRLVLDRIPPELRPGFLIENPERMPEVYFENNRVTGCPNIRLSSSKPMRIRSNRLALHSTAIVISDLLRYWYESGTAQDAVVENNTFLPTCRRCIVIESTRSPSAAHRHGRIEIRNNHFPFAGERAISASCTEELIVENNVWGENSSLSECQ